MNAAALLEAQRNYSNFGACVEEMQPLVRPPTASERRAAHWQPLSVTLRQQQHDLLDPFIQKQSKLFDLLASQISDERAHYLVDPANDAQISQQSAQKHEADYTAINQVIVGQFPVYPPIYDILDDLSNWGSVDGAFACTALLLAARQSTVRHLFELRPEYIERLVGYVLGLEQTMLEAALHFLCQTVFDLDLETHLPEFSVGILILAAALYPSQKSHLQALSTWVLQEEQRLGTGAIRQSIFEIAEEWGPVVATILQSVVDDL